MLVEEIDDIGPEPLQRRLGDLPDVLGAAVHAALSAISIEFEAELGGDRHLIAERGEGLAQ
jgi:hypothetical protein